MRSQRGEGSARPSLPWLLLLSANTESALLPFDLAPRGWLDADLLAEIYDAVLECAAVS